MPAGTTETQEGGGGERGPIEAGATGAGVPADPAADAAPVPPSGHRLTRRRKLLIGVLGALVLAGAAAFAMPWIELTLSTVSTDDAYVNGHLTFVAPRVAGQVSRVLVDDNNRVHRGDLLAALDKEPYQVALSQKKAAVDTASADLQAAIASVRGIEGETRSRRWSLQRAVESVDNQIALLHARVAALDKSKAAFTLAQVEFDRARRLLPTAAGSREVYDQRQAELTTANANVTEALAEVYRSAPPWACLRNPARAKASARCRPISIRPSPRSSRRRPA
jgi:membrane fusion protein (multidrug efflux system)